jgi:hypothetical protein
MKTFAQHAALALALAAGIFSAWGYVRLVGG